MSPTVVTMVGFIAGVLTTAAFIPQVVKVWKTRSARDISLGMYAILVSGIVLWLVYGLLLGSWPIILANILTLVLAVAILVMKLRFG
jgi:MtN3 and saliva related transmembrane protein